jgi:glucose/arabinose dehydrogenase
MATAAMLAGCAGAGQDRMGMQAAGSSAPPATPMSSTESQAARETENEGGTMQRIASGVFEPRKLTLTPDMMGAVRAPQGYTVSVFAKDLGNPRILAVADNGNVYVTRRAEGDVLLLRDGNGDGVADEQKTVARRPGMHGIAIDGSTVYLATVKQVFKADIKADGTFSELEMLVDDLPDGGQHPNRTIVPGPDNMLYISVGSTCNACAETNPENATILRMSKDGKSRTIYASGLRNTIGYAFHPTSGELWAWIMASIGWATRCSRKN